MIIFEKVRWKNFLSTGNYWTEIDFRRSNNTLIVGKNGAGKSTVLDALCFALFGKPFRKINKPILINSINRKDCCVEAEFSIGQKKYKVVRGMKPNIFSIYADGKLLNQDAANKDYQDVLENGILKIAMKSFTQIVVLGSASFTPFMQLSAPDRRTIIEDLLDIQIFTSMNTLVKQKLSDLKDEALKIKYDIDLTKERIQLQRKNIEEHKKLSDGEIDKKRAEIENSHKQIAELEKYIEGVQRHINSMRSKVTEESALIQKNKKLIQLESKIQTNINKNKKDIEFYEHNDSCPTCKQAIETGFKSNQIKERQEKVTAQTKGVDEISEQIGKLGEKLNEISRISKSIAEHNSEIAKHNSSISAANRYIKKLNEEIEEIVNRKNNFESDNQSLKDLMTQMDKLIEKQEANAIERHYYDISSTLLKDGGIKTKIIKQYLPIMNKLINKYLTAMDSFVNFNLDENFNETIKSRHRDEFSYNSFSEGEKMRIDLAIMFTWRQIAKLKNSTNTNLLILDEVFDSSLDAGGTEDFMKLMNEIGSDTNVFVISHKGDQLFDKFRSVITFEQKNNFSRIAK